MSITASVYLYWVNALPGSQTDEKRLNDIRRVSSQYAKVTPVTVKAAAQQWPDPKKAWKMVATPQPQSVAAK